MQSGARDPGQSRRAFDAEPAMEISRDGSLLTFYVDVKDQVTVICPECKKKKSINASKFKDSRTALRVKCPCGEEFKCVFEFRKFFRKVVQLPGEYANPKTGESGRMTVENISLEGIGFSTLDENNIQSGDILAVNFTLDNKQKEEVERTIKVTSVCDRSVGAMYFGITRNKTVGFYLMP